MTFSDDDLKRLKESLMTYEDEQHQCYRVKEFKALLARLEAAENPARGSQHNHAVDRPPQNLCRRCKADEAWRKAAGR